LDWAVGTALLVLFLICSLAYETFFPYLDITSVLLAAGARIGFCVDPEVPGSGFFFFFFSFSFLISFSLTGFISFRGTSAFIA